MLLTKRIQLFYIYIFILQDYSERDCDSSLSFSQSISEKNCSKSHSNRATSASAQPTPHSPQSPPRSNRLDSNKKSMSSPAVGIVLPQIMQESNSMGTMQIQTQQSQQQQQQQQQPQQSQQTQNSNKVSDITQDNSVTSEPSETTTTTTTTSEDVVTTYKETSQRESPGQSHAKQNGSERKCETGDANGGGGNSCNGAGVTGNGITGGTNTLTDTSEHFNDEKFAEKSEGSEPASDGRDVATLANDGRGDFTNSVENSQALDSEELAVQQALPTGASGTTIVTTNTAAYGVTRADLKVESSDVYQIVDIIRRNTNLSFDLSCEALRVVLTSLEQLYNGAINPYLEAVAIHVTDKVETPKALLGMTHDSKRLQYIFSQLADCKNDTEQRSWMLYEDEDDIIQFLEELVEILVIMVNLVTKNQISIRNIYLE